MRVADRCASTVYVYVIPGPWPALHHSPPAGLRSLTYALAASRNWPASPPPNRYEHHVSVPIQAGLSCWWPPSSKSTNRTCWPALARPQCVTAAAAVARTVNEPLARSCWRECRRGQALTNTGQHTPLAPYRRTLCWQRFGNVYRRKKRQLYMYRGTRNTWRCGSVAMALFEQSTAVRSAGQPLFCFTQQPPICGRCIQVQFK